MSEIRVTLQGNAGDQPQLWTGSSRPFARVNVASTPRIRVDEDWTDGDTQWVQVKAWGRLAENMAASIRKGDAVIVTGTFRHEEYTNDEGVRFKTAVVHASGVGFDLIRTRAQAVNVRSDEPTKKSEESPWSEMTPNPEAATDDEAAVALDAEDEVVAAPF